MEIITEESRFVVALTGLEMKALKKLLGGTDIPGRIEEFGLTREESEALGLAYISVFSKI